MARADFPGPVWFQDDPEPKMVDLSATRIVGVVNVTPDSFSDGGRYKAPDAAIRHGLELLEAGAGELDVGGESTRPGATPVSVAEECARVVPAIGGLRAAGVTAPISVDTFHVETARVALDAGADGVNDVSGFCDAEMRELAATSGARCVVMADSDVLRVRAAALEQAGVTRERIMLDPGFGFTASRDDDIRLFGQTPQLAARLRAEGYATYVGLSRKRFLSTLFGDDRSLADRDQATAELSAVLAAAGVTHLRVHDAAGMHAELQRLASAPPQIAYVALGSNVEPREDHLRAALSFLKALPATTLAASAPLYVSEPAYYSDQPTFCNTVVRLDTRLGPRALFALLQAAERLAGRVKIALNGPRNIDLDLLSYGDVILKTEALTLPHPRIAERAFVVEPLLALEPDYRFPTGARLTRDAEAYGAIIEVHPALLPGGMPDRF
ncbi:MAG: 2-amino-4-hydroxy-6-hydroxymethyldihydropteridine diphosphokinase [Coriobacteriia bacterium]|nr:2-amino-4-hydroxy-6-hydroxymethyldihydropteridine diphosphokinase [Coriobacteriia bacterium]